VALPELIIEVDFITGPLEVPHAWVDISDRVRDFSIQAGRQTELGRTEVGGGRLLLMNQDRALDPTNAAGPYFPNILPMRHVRLRAVHEGVTYDLGRGYIRGWPQGWRARVAAEVPVEWEDAFSVLARYEMADFTARPVEPAGARIEAVLTEFGWPGTGQVPPGVTWWLVETAGSGELGDTTTLGEAGRVIDPGRSEVLAHVPEGNLLEYLLKVAEDTERGQLYVRPNGELTFHQRPVATGSPLAVFGDDLAGGELRMRDLVLAYDDEKLWTIGRVSIEGSSATHEASDAEAVAAYGPRVLSVSGTLFASEADAEALAGYLVGRFGRPRVRPERLTVLPRLQDAAEWSHVLGRELNDRILVRRRPPGGGEAIEIDARIVGVGHEGNPRSWSTTWTLITTEAVTWILGASEQGELGVATVLGF
jgi:hypothetical protein